IQDRPTAPAVHGRAAPRSETRFATLIGTNGAADRRPASSEVPKMGTMKELESTSTLFGSNAPFIEELYESYLADPASVAPEWRTYFDEVKGDAADVSHAAVLESFRELARNRKVAGAMVDETTMHKQVLVLRLISKFRTLGMLHADLDPLKRQEPPYIPDLDLRTYGFTESDLATPFD